MATFIAKVQGSRGSAHRLGHSIISADVNSWDIGVQVIGRRAADGSVSFEIFETGGTNGGSITFIGEIKNRRTPPKA